MNHLRHCSQNAPPSVMFALGCPGSYWDKIYSFKSAVFSRNWQRTLNYLGWKGMFSLEPWRHKIWAANREDLQGHFNWKHICMAVVLHIKELSRLNEFDADFINQLKELPNGDMFHMIEEGLVRLIKERNANHHRQSAR